MAESIPFLHRRSVEDPLTSHETDNHEYHDITLPELECEKPLELRKSRWRTTNAGALHYLELTQSCLISALPRILQPGGIKKGKLHPTGYLDAVRGWAAFSVACYHMGMGGHARWTRGPVIWGFFNGLAMADLFFVISGYVLSHRMLKFMRNLDRLAIMDTLASSTFRRWLRLYGSTAFASFVTMVATFLGWCHPTHRFPTFLGQLWDWIWDTIYSTNPFADLHGWWYPKVFRTHYLDQMWTIPIEFRGSMVVFIFCAATCKLPVRTRMIICWLCILACYVWHTIDIALFLMGLFNADLSISLYPERFTKTPQVVQTTDDSLPTRAAPRWSMPQPKKVLSTTGAICVVVLALFLISQPGNLGRGGPWPWPHLAKFTPSYYYKYEEDHFYVSMGAGLLILALESAPILQKPFNSNFMQYFGDLSFGIYAMHNTVFWSLFQRGLKPYFQQHLHNPHLIWWMCWVPTILVVIWAADYFDRVDRRLVSYGKWLQDKTFRKID